MFLSFPLVCVFLNHPGKTWILSLKEEKVVVTKQPQIVPALSFPVFCVSNHHNLHRTILNSILPQLMQEPSLQVLDLISRNCESWAMKKDFREQMSSWGNTRSAGPSLQKAQYHYTKPTALEITTVLVFDERKSPRLIRSASNSE